MAIPPEDFDVGPHHAVPLLFPARGARFGAFWAIERKAQIRNLLQVKAL